MLMNYYYCYDSPYQATFHWSLYKNLIQQLSCSIHSEMHVFSHFCTSDVRTCDTMDGILKL